MYCVDNDVLVVRASAVEVPSFQESSEAVWRSMLARFNYSLESLTGTRRNVNSDVHIVRFVLVDTGYVNH